MMINLYQLVSLKYGIPPQPDVFLMEKNQLLVEVKKGSSCLLTPQINAQAEEVTPQVNAQAEEIKAQPQTADNKQQTQSKINIKNTPLRNVDTSQVDVWADYRSRKPVGIDDTVWKNFESVEALCESTRKYRHGCPLICNSVHAYSQPTVIPGPGPVENYILNPNRGSGMATECMRCSAGHRIYSSNCLPDPVYDYTPTVKKELVLNDQITKTEKKLEDLNRANENLRAKVEICTKKLRDEMDTPFFECLKKVMKGKKESFDEE